MLLKCFPGSCTLDVCLFPHLTSNGTVRFGGAIDFLGGQWAGIELDEAVGKNDGSLKGIRFFTCKPKFDKFVMEWASMGDQIYNFDQLYMYIYTAASFY